MASAPPAMIIPATAILAALADVARFRSVMNWLSSLVAPALQEQRTTAGPDLRVRLAPSRAGRHLVHAWQAALLGADRNQEGGYSDDPNRDRELEIADDQRGSGQSPSAFSGPFDLPARHMAEDDPDRVEHENPDQSRDCHSIRGRHGNVDRWRRPRWLPPVG